MLLAAKLCIRLRHQRSSQSSCSLTLPLLFLLVHTQTICIGNWVSSDIESLRKADMRETTMPEAISDYSKNMKLSEGFCCPPAASGTLPPRLGDGRSNLPQHQFWHLILVPLQL